MGYDSFLHHSLFTRFGANNIFGPESYPLRIQKQAAMHMTQSFSIITSPRDGQKRVFVREPKRSNLADRVSQIRALKHVSTLRIPSPILMLQSSIRKESRAADTRRRSAARQDLLDRFDRVKSKMSRREFARTIVDPTETDETEIDRQHDLLFDFMIDDVGLADDVSLPAPSPVPSKDASHTLRTLERDICNAVDLIGETRHNLSPKSCESENDLLGKFLDELGFQLDAFEDDLDPDNTYISVDAKKDASEGSEAAGEARKENVDANLPRS